MSTISIDTDPFAGAIPAEIRLKTLASDWQPPEVLSEQAARAVLIEDLDWQLRLPLWSDTTAPFNLIPLQVERNPRMHRSEWKQVMQADLKSPLVLLEAEPGLIVLDGLHRLLKARHLGLPYLPARSIDLTQLTALV